MAAIENIKESLSVLGLKNNAQRVLLYLIEHDVSPVSEVSVGLNLPKTSVYDALDELIQKSLVTEYSQEKGKEFGIIDNDRLARVSELKISELKAAQDNLLTYVKGTKKIKTVARPKVKFYIGDEGIRQAFRDTMWHDKCKETFIMWPTKEMVSVLGHEFSEWHSKQRLKHGVVIYALRKDSDRDMENESGKNNMLINSEGWRKDRHIRFTPKNIKWDMAFWVYDDQCLFSSSGAEKFAFTVHSREFADTMKTLWEQMWKISSK